MGQVDQNVPGGEFFAQEAEFQRHAASGAALDDPDRASPRLRVGDRAVSRERFTVVQGRSSN
ncbi:hypothetical protein [Saccharothrix syringae]|uniref:Uncharacterized protein n=1 Tax=Saccharothrix syringae TaxID=103733 RepID=A0A5Q0GUU9_SACSY|nr:hypothetical protein [Saccharothrix syringae]QFZ17778.1 hypothetical protein EKG83_10060 [Saccharothrix syringae]